MSFKANISLLIFCLENLCSYYCIVFPFISVNTCFISCSCVGVIYIYNCYIFFLGQFHNHYILSFFVSYNNFCSKVSLVWYKHWYSSFLLISICMPCLFTSPDFKSVCVFMYLFLIYFILDCAGSSLLHVSFL